MFVVFVQWGMKIPELALGELVHLDVQCGINKPCKDTGLGPKDRTVLAVPHETNCSFWARLIIAASCQFCIWLRYLPSAAVSSTVLVWAQGSATGKGSGNLQKMGITTG